MPSGLLPQACAAVGMQRLAAKQVANLTRQKFFPSGLKFPLCWLASFSLYRLGVFHHDGILVFRAAHVPGGA